jgi:hypothetical protein
MVTAAVMSIVATAVMGITISVFHQTGTIVNRRDVFADGRIALDRMSKQIRQGESVDTAYSNATRIKVSSYLDGTVNTFAWRVTGSSPPYLLQESRDGGSTFVTVSSAVRNPNLFVYTVHAGVADQVTLNLTLGTESSTVALTSDVYLRNAST